jgi:hypothetical protein
MFGERDTWTLDQTQLSRALEYADGEKDLQALWRKVFISFAVAERDIPLLQQKFLPWKYRRHLVEFDGKDALFSNKKRDLWRQKE